MTQKRLLFGFVILFFVLILISVILAIVGAETHRPVILAIVGGVIAGVLSLTPGIYLRIKKHRTDQ